MHYSAFCNIGPTLEAIEERVRVMSDKALLALLVEGEESGLSKSCIDLGEMGRLGEEVVVLASRVGKHKTM
jgi:hypothetical protein